MAIDNLAFECCKGTVRNDTEAHKQVPNVNKAPCAPAGDIQELVPDMCVKRF